jgi:hypothetical protein
LEEVIIIGEQTTVYCSTSEFRAVPIRQFITENYNQVDVDGFLYMLSDHIPLICLSSLIKMKRVNMLDLI